MSISHVGYHVVVLQLVGTAAQHDDWTSTERPLSNFSWPSSEGLSNLVTDCNTKATDRVPFFLYLNVMFTNAHDKLHPLPKGLC